MPIIRECKNGGCLIILPPPTGQQCPFFYFDRVLRTNPVCLSGLFPDLHLPTHCIAVTTSRTTSTLHDFSPPLLSRVVVTQTGVVELRRSLAGGAGVSSPPIIIRSALDHVYHLQSFLGNSYKVVWGLFSPSHLYYIKFRCTCQVFSGVFRHQFIHSSIYRFPVLVICLNDLLIVFYILP